MTFLLGFLFGWAVVAFVLICNALAEHRRNNRGIGKPMLWQIGQFNKNNRTKGKQNED